MDELGDVDRNGGRRRYPDHAGGIDAGRWWADCDDRRRIGGLIWGATRIFAQLQGALNDIWDVSARIRTAA
jgi:hypothetical protein